MDVEGTVFDEQNPSAPLWDLFNATMEVSGTTSEYTPMTKVWAIILEGNNTATFSWSISYDDTLGIDIDNMFNLTTRTLWFDTVDGPAYKAEVIITSTNVIMTQNEIATAEMTAIVTGIVRQK